MAAPDHRVFFPVPGYRRGVQEYAVPLHEPSEDKHTRARMDPVTMSRSNTLDYLNNPSPQTLGRSPLEWLDRLQRPTVVRVAGRDSSRTRAMATLLHSNEPSGLFAIHRWLLEQHTPEVPIPKPAKTTKRPSWKSCAKFSTHRAPWWKSAPEPASTPSTSLPLCPTCNGSPPTTPERRTWPLPDCNRPPYPTSSQSLSWT